MFPHNYLHIFSNGILQSSFRMNSLDKRKSPTACPTNLKEYKLCFKNLMKKVVENLRPVRNALKSINIAMHL